MPYVPVPKDLDAVKAKVAGPFTKRQAVCFTLAAATGLPAYFLGRRFLTNDAAAALLLLCAAPCFLLAMYRKNGQPFERVALNYIRYRFVRPRTRPYREENIYAALTRQYRLDREASVFAEKRTGAARRKARARAKSGRAARNQ